MPSGSVGHDLANCREQYQQQCRQHDAQRDACCTRQLRLGIANIYGHVDDDDSRCGSTMTNMSGSPLNSERCIFGVLYCFLR